MDDLQTSDELTFIPEQIEPIVFAVIEDVLKDTPYEEGSVSQWVDKICEDCMTGLMGTNKPFKYVVNCVIMQKNGAGLHSGLSCEWDISNDNVVVCRWPNDKHRDPNSRCYCLVTVFGVSM